ncbi:MAG: DUF4115 domain-containing protein, partial [Paracoccaceae bacterium]
LFREVQQVQFTPVDQAPGITSNIIALSASGGLSADDQAPGYVAASADILDRLYRPQALEVPVLVARDGPISTLDPANVGTLAAPVTLPETLALASVAVAPQVEPAPVQVIAPDGAEVVLFAVRPSWVRVRAGDGTVLFEKILDAGERYVLPKSQEPPVLRAGNAGSVYFVIDGVTYGPAGTGPSVVKDVVMAAASLTAIYVTADPTKDGDLARFVELSDVHPSGEN